MILLFYNLYFSSRNKKKCLSLANCKLENFSGLKLKYRKKINGIRNDSKNYLLLCTYFTPARIQHNGVFLNSHSYFYAPGFSRDIPNTSMKSNVQIEIEKLHHENSFSF